MAEANHLYRCDSCQISIKGKGDYLKHMNRGYHPQPINCGECELSYVHLTSLMRHIRDVHIQPPPRIPVVNQNEGMDEAVHAMENDDNLNEGDAEYDNNLNGAEGEEEDERNSSDEDVPIDLMRSAGMMVLNLRQTGGITGSSIERFQDECFKIMKKVASSMKQKVKIFLTNENIDTPSSRALLEELRIENPFEHIKTIKQQLVYFSLEFGLVKPETKFLGYRTDYRLSPVTGLYEPTQVPSSFEYIPVIKTLTLIMCNPKYRNLVLAEKASDDGILRTYLDGRRAKSHPLVAKHPNILRLQLYWDDIEVVNPLGSKTTIHKIAAFYFSLQNLPLVENSQLSSVFLLALAYSEDLKDAGRFEKVLAPVLYDLKKLESEAGIAIQIDNQPFQLRATLCVLCADGLAAHEILGLLSPSARHFCRKCMVSRPQFRTDLNAVGLKRTKAMLEEQVRRVMENSNHTTQFGVRSSCPLHLSKGFDASQDGVFDIFHELLEGVCHWVVSLTLRSFILKSKVFTLEDFNGRLSAFNYGVTDIKNKPSANFSDKSLTGSKLKQSGSQMWCLTRIFGFLVSDVPQNDSNLKLVNLLQSILMIVFAEEVREDDIIRLEILIEEHHRLFQELHVNEEVNVLDELSDDSEDEPEDTDLENTTNTARIKLKKVKPGNKLHHMKHLPDEFREHGNLVRYWCARYEGRHHIFCKYGSVCCNFINIVKSMAQMFQLSTLSGLLKSSYRAEEMELLGSAEVAVELCQHRDLLVATGVRPAAVVFDVDAIRIAGEDYRRGLFILLEKESPTFALIQHVYVFEKRVLLVVLPWKTIMFEERYCAYKVEPIPESHPLIVAHNALVRHGAFAPWNPWGQRTTYIAPRTIIF